MGRDFSIDDVRRHWDRVADIYDETNDTVRAIHDQRFVESFREFPVPLPKRILVAWSRNGEALEFLRSRGVEAGVVNLEVSMRMIQAGRARGRQGAFVQSDLSLLPVRAAAFDLVWSLETLEHCPDPRAFLTEVYRALRPGGTLILSCPPAFAEIVLRIYERFATNHGEGPHAFPRSRTVKRWLADAGFELRRHRGTLFVPFGSPTFQRIDRWLQGPLNALGLSDLGIRQFFVARKARA